MRVRAALGAVFLLGLWSNLAQVAALRLFIGQFYGTEIHLGLFLGVWLAGVALGGAVGAYWFFRPRVVIWLMVLAPLISLIIFAGGITTLSVHSGGFIATWPVLTFLVALVLPLAIPVGLVLPAILRQIPSAELGEAYGIEALGSFAGGIIFSLLLGGYASGIKTLAILPILPIAASLILSLPKERCRLKAVFLAVAVLVISIILPRFENWANDRAWKHIHSGYDLKCTIETPYQRLQIGEYQGQKSLFSNGTFVAAWPDPVRAGERVHSFLTVCPNPHRVLLAGAPTPDLVEQALTWPDLQLTIADLDADLLSLLLKNEKEKFASYSIDYGASLNNQIIGKNGTSIGYRVGPRLKILAADPRTLTRNNPASFDGIMVLFADPTTLVGNRIFTQEGLADLATGLASDGVLAIAVTGTENYLGPDLESVILSTHRALLPSFAEVFAVPGETITFWAAKQHGVLATQPEVLAERFRKRQKELVIASASFRAESFYNLLLPFRVEEVRNWLSRNTVVPNNTDLHPQAFLRQLMLWDIYSGSNLSFLFRWAQMIDLKKALVCLVLLAVVLALVGWLAGPQAGRVGLLSVGVAISGAGGLLAEIVLLLVYQSRHGAMFRMAALFFGIYMLGLACGARFGRKLGFATIGRLRLLKVAQLGMAAICLAMLHAPADWQVGAIIGLGVFLVAFLDGIEFPAVDALLRELGIARERSAGWLIFADNFGALWIGLASGWWILPNLGLEGALCLITAALALNLLALMLVPFV